MLRTIRNFHEDAKELVRKYHTLEIFFWIEAFWCFIRYGASPNDYIRYEFCKKKGREINEFITARRQGKLCRSLNKQPDGSPLVDDKLKYNRKLAKYIHREWLHVNNGSDVQIIFDFLKKRNSAIVKRLHLCGGEGIEKIDYSDVEQMFGGGQRC